MERASKILSRFCIPRCLRRISDGDHPGHFVCRNPNNLKLSPDNTKYSFIHLPKNLTTNRKDIPVGIQLKEEYYLNEFVIEGEHIFNHEFLTPTAMFLQLIPPTT